MSIVNNTVVEGDVSVGRNAAIGGRAMVQGSAVVNGNVIVRGWLNADNIKGPNMGVFQNTAALNAAFTSPQKGWFAGVVNSNKIDMYAYNGSQWFNTGVTIDTGVDFTVEIEGDGDIDTLRREVAALNSQVTALRGEATTATNTANAANETATLAFTLPCVYFNSILGEPVEIVDDNIDDIGADNYVDTVFYSSEQHTFVCQHEGEYYHMWDKKKGQTAYMDEVDGHVLRNRLYIDKDGVVYYCNVEEENYVLREVMGARFSAKMNLVENATNGNFPVLASGGALVNSSYGPSSFATAAQGSLAASAEQAANKVTSFGGTPSNTKYPSEKLVYDSLNAKAAITDLGRAVGEAVTATFRVAAEGKYNLCGEEFEEDALLLVVVNGKGYVSAREISLSSTSAQEVKYVFASSGVIPANVFKGLDGLNENVELKGLHIPSFVHGIEDNACGGCTSLVSIDCEAMTPPDLHEDAFADVPMENVTLTVHSVVKTSYDDGNTTWGGVGTVTTY